jgi:hypothetical protein
MPIQREGEFLVSYDLHDTPTLYLESSRLAECVAEARRRSIRGVGGSPGLGFRETHLDFLHELPWLERVWFWDVALERVDGLYALRELRDFGVHPRRPAIDFAPFEKLREVFWHYNPRDTHVDQLPVLTSLALWHFNPRSKRFDAVRLPAQLEKLEIAWANPATLDGLPTLPGLRSLEIHRCRNLESLARLPEIAPNLERLVVTTSGRLTDVGSVRRLPRLCVALLDGKPLVPAAPV